MADTEQEGTQAGHGSMESNQMQNQNMMWNAGEGQGQNQMFGSGFGFDPTQAGFAGMDWSGASGFNPMMQMQNGMAGGMANGNWGAFPGMMSE